MENYFLDNGLSWTLSKMLPYLLMIIIGVILFVFLRLSNKTWIKYSSFTLLFIPFGIYFMISPIYEGDFSNNFVDQKYNPDFTVLERGQMTIISIPNCPFCYQSISLMKRIEARVNKELNVNFIVCSDRKNDLDLYKDIAGKNVNVILGENNSTELMNLARNQFPTFVYVNKSGDIRIWSNDNFGAPARDWLEENMGY